MRKVLIALAALCAIACSKSSNQKQELPIAATVYINAGEQYTWTETIFGLKYDHTADLLQKITFRDDGSGIRYVYYQRAGSDMGKHYSVTYAWLSFTWTYAGGVLTLTNTDHDAVIPDVVRITGIEERGVSAVNGWRAKYNGKDIVIHRYASGIEL